ncbi:hypothetical protein OGAPHI_003627 [Ogataea philodendri]|uniref:Uncharacterized protein n=1 Tax=Ogataea philodendri TaxID=1378263 RepID=A0A9P8P4L1_9ASCO|nr:uncharacterized protein OGAPHI_003627 [Ogataea philodendri]KAH3665443.1 hypothetical protein OGAPHI_003627 [Ogataea philodendri]
MTVGLMIETTIGFLVTLKREKYFFESSAAKTRLLGKKSNDKFHSVSIEACVFECSDSILEETFKVTPLVHFKLKTRRMNAAMTLV